MKVRITFELDEASRKGIGAVFGKGPADYKTCRSWIEMTVKATVEDVCADVDFPTDRGRDE